MKFSDALIIYFSIGAPVAVYFYLQNRARFDRKEIRLESVLTFLFWIPAATRFFYQSDLIKSAKFFNRSDEHSPRFEREENLSSLRKRIEKLMLARGGKYSVFKFREVLDRYAGLTLAGQEARDGKGNDEFFRAAQNENFALAAKCFERRNRRRLLFHQSSARRDFLNILVHISESEADRAAIGALAAEFAEVSGDFDAVEKIDEMFAVALPTNVERMPATVLEKDLWTPEIKSRPRTQPTFNSISTIMRTTQKAAATRLRKKE